MNYSYHLNNSEYVVFLGAVLKAGRAVRPEPGRVKRRLISFQSTDCKREAITDVHAGRIEDRMGDLAGQDWQKVEGYDGEKENFKSHHEINFTTQDENLFSDQYQEYQEYQYFIYSAER